MFYLIISAVWCRIGRASFSASAIDIITWSCGMAITKAEKAAYNDYVAEFKGDIEASLTRIKQADQKMRQMPRIAQYKKIEMVVEYLKIIKLYLSMNDASIEILQLKQESYLNEARKAFYKVLQLFEDVLGADVDRSLNDNDDYLVKIDRVTPLQSLRLMQHVDQSLEDLIDRMGTGSKWKWSFVDMFGRVAVIKRNIISFSDTQKFRDPRSEFYVERQELVQMCKESLKDAAQQYRTKYEQSTKATGDLLKSIELLTALRKIHVIFSETEEATKMKTTIDALRQKIEDEEKQKEKEKLKKKK